jgi:hypothetical protein
MEGGPGTETTAARLDLSIRSPNVTLIGQLQPLGEFCNSVSEPLVARVFTICDRASRDRHSRIWRCSNLLSNRGANRLFGSRRRCRTAPERDRKDDRAQRCQPPSHVVEPGGLMSARYQMARSACPRERSQTGAALVVRGRAGRCSKEARCGGRGSPTPQCRIE